MISGQRGHASANVRCILRRSSIPSSLGSSLQPGSPWEPWLGWYRINLFILINDLSVNADPLSLRNQQGGGFMNGWTSQTDKAFYQMQYLTGHETDEMKMVLGISQYDNHLDNQPGIRVPKRSIAAVRGILQIESTDCIWVSCFGCFVISWLVNKALNLVTTVTQFIFLIVPITIGLLWYVDIITMDSTGIRYRHDRLSFKFFVPLVLTLERIRDSCEDLSAIWAS